MKKILSIILVTALLISLCACGSSSGSTRSLSDRAASQVKSTIQVYINMSYEIVGVPQVTTYVKDLGGGEYQVTGKVTIRDEYGDSYTGKYDATATYSESSDRFDVDFDVDSLYKD